MNKIKIFTDASFWGNPRQMKNANIGIFIPNLYIKFNEEIGVRDNNEAEYFAILKAITMISKHKYSHIDIISDSKVCTYSLNQYITTGIQRPNKYNTIQQKIIETLKKININVNFIHQKAHSKCDNSVNWIGNNIADKLSKRTMNDIDQKFLEKYLQMFYDKSPIPWKLTGDAWD